MPNWEYLYTTGTSASSDTFWTSPSPLTPMQIQQQFEEYQQRKAEQHQRAQYLWEQQMDEEKQLQEDKENYPLFFLKEGIV